MNFSKKLKFTYKPGDYDQFEKNNLFTSDSELIFEKMQIQILNKNKEKGGFFLLVGKNGTGKSTFLNGLSQCSKFSIIDNDEKKYTKKNIEFLTDDKENDKLTKTKSKSRIINLLQEELFDTKSQEELTKDIQTKFTKEGNTSGLSVEKFISNYTDQQKQENKNFQQLNKEIKNKINMTLYPRINLSLESRMKIGENDNDSIDLDELASGFKRILIFYCDYLLSKNNQKEKPETKVFLIDEIELFLHPSLIRLFLRIVKDLKAEGIYFIVSTHSEFVVKHIIELVDNIYVFSRIKENNKENSQVIFHTGIFWNDSKKIIKEMSEELKKYFPNSNSVNSNENNFFNKTVEDNVKGLTELKSTEEKFFNKTLAQVKVSLSEIFFTNKIIFVEGPSDQIIFNKVVSEIDAFKDYSVLFMNGKAMFFHTLALTIFAKKCWKDDFKFYFILDRDKKKIKDELIKNNIDKNQGKCYFLKKGEIEDYYGIEEKRINSDKCFFALEFLHDPNKKEAYEKLRKEIIDFSKSK